MVRDDVIGYICKDNFSNFWRPKSGKRYFLETRLFNFVAMKNTKKWEQKLRPWYSKEFWHLLFVGLLITETSMLWIDWGLIFQKSQFWCWSIFVLPHCPKKHGPFGVKLRPRADRSSEITFLDDCGKLRRTCFPSDERTLLITEHLRTALIIHNKGEQRSPRLWLVMAAITSLPQPYLSTDFAPWSSWLNQLAAFFANIPLLDHISNPGAKPKN